MKSDKQTVQQRVDEILSLRLLGALPGDIRKHAQEAEWNVGARQLKRYIHRADVLLASYVERSRPALFAHHFAARRALYARAMSVSDYRTAASILKDEADLLGLYPPKRTELSGIDGGPVQVEMTDDERLAALTALFARVGTGSDGQNPLGQAESNRPALGPPGGDVGGDDPGPLADGLAPFPTFEGFVELRTPDGEELDRRRNRA